MSDTNNPENATPKLEPQKGEAAHKRAEQMLREKPRVRLAATTGERRGWTDLRRGVSDMKGGIAMIL